jgi:hypothetical protein
LRRQSGDDIGGQRDGVATRLFIGEGRIPHHARNRGHRAVVAAARAEKPRSPSGRGPATDGRPSVIMSLITG